MAEDRDKPSWRERDARANRSRHVSGDEGSKPKGKAAYAEKRAMTSAKKALDDLFGVSKASPAQKALAALARVPSSEKVSAAKAHISDFGLPGDVDGLMVFLDVDDEDILSDVLEALEALSLQALTKEKQALLEGKLNVVVLTLESFPLTVRMKKLSKALSATLA